jgi:hypothetical protein
MSKRRKRYKANGCGCKEAGAPVAANFRDNWDENYVPNGTVGWAITIAGVAVLGYGGYWLWNKGKKKAADAAAAAKQIEASIVGGPSPDLTGELPPAPGVTSHARFTAPPTDYVPLAKPGSSYAAPSAPMLMPMLSMTSVAAPKPMLMYSMTTAPRPAAPALQLPSPEAQKRGTSGMDDVSGRYDDFSDYMGAQNGIF